MAIGDFNGDHKPDVAIVSLDGVEILLNGGSGKLQTGADYPCVSHASGNTSISTQDFNES